MKEVLIFGRGELYRQKEEDIKKSYQIIGYLDNAVSGEEYLDNKPVHNPLDLYKLPQCSILIVSVHFIEMWRQLKDLEIADERIIFGVLLGTLSTELERELYTEDATITATGGRIRYSSDCIGIDAEFSNEEEFKDTYRQIYRKKHKEITAIQSLSVFPVSRIQGLERGTAIDRFYIERFLETNSDDIRGVCLEVADDLYIRKYGGERVNQTIISHVKGWGERSIRANFETGEGLEENMADCIICTQVMQYILDVKSAFFNIYRSLKPNGVALLTLPGIKSISIYDNENWGERWSFTVKSVTELCEAAIPNVSYTINTYGNAKIAVAYLYGLCVEDMDEKDFLYMDSQFPFLITLRIDKRITVA